MKKYIIPILMLLVSASACVEPDETQEQQASITGQERVDSDGQNEERCYENPDGEVFCVTVDPNDPDGQGGNYDPEAEENSYCYLDDPSDPDSDFTCGERRVDPNDPDGQASDEDPEGANLSGCTNPDASKC